MKSEDNYYLTFLPKNKFLKKFIAYYYFDVSKQTVGSKKFIFYPHYKNALTIYKNAEVKILPDSSISRPNTSVPYSFLYTGAELHLRHATIIPPFDKIGIVFQPLGLNHFLSKSDSIQEIISSSQNGAFDYFGTKLKNTCDAIYNVSLHDQKVTLLDRFFEEQYIGFEEKRLQDAIQLLFEHPEITASEIATTVNTSRKTLYRLFKKHTNCSIETYKGIIKFRKVLANYHALKKPGILTEVAYANNYYDQSDFINHFKKLTSVTPKKFFSELSKLGTEDTYWTLLD